MIESTVELKQSVQDEIEINHIRGIAKFGASWMDMNRYAKAICQDICLTDSKGGVDERLEFLITQLLIKFGK